MRFPWVSREAYDERGRANALLTEALGKAVERNVDLTTALLRSQRLGVPPMMPFDAREVDLLPDVPRRTNGNITIGELASTVAGMARAELAQPDELRALIDEKCGPNLRRRAVMLRQLAADRAAGIADEKIQAAIENGISTEGVPA